MVSRWAAEAIALVTAAAEQLLGPTMIVAATAGADSASTIVRSTEQKIITFLFIPCFVSSLARALRLFAGQGAQQCAFPHAVRGNRASRTFTQIQLLCQRPPRSPRNVGFSFSFVTAQSCRAPGPGALTSGIIRLLVP